MNKKYFIITYGCQMNQSDSERIAKILEKSGHKPAKADSSADSSARVLTEAEALAKADLIVINACSVRQSAVHRVYAKIDKLYKDKKIILAGCVLEKDKKKLADKISGFWHPDKYFQTCPANGKLLPHSSASVPHSSAFIPIMTGCNNFCSYCVVPFTRGREKSRPAEDIINEIKLLVKKGYKEIMLLGQNVNSYRGSDKNSSSEALAKEDNLINFPALLRFLNSLPGEFTIKFMTSHPKDMSDELINTIAQCEKISREIHLPIQSGDNTILKRMNRKYTVGHYQKLIKKILKKIPDAKISTDIIVGFPEETKKQFANTVKLCKEIKFNKAYINKYSPRFGTTAYKLNDNVPREEKKRRWKILDGITNKKTI